MTSASPDLDAVDRPQAASLPRLNPSLALRLYATSTLHRLVPSIVATRLARFVGQRRWAQPSSREDAITWAKAVLGSGADEGDVVALARQALCEQAMKDELFWRPWLARREPVEGLERLQAVRREGRGALITYPHLSEHTLLMLAIATKGPRLFLPRKRAPSQERLRPHVKGLRRRELLTRMERTGSRWVGRGGSFAVLRGFIERGEVVMIAIDVPGSRPSTYLGRETGLASGAAELSFTTGAPVFPAFACRDGSRLRFVLEAPVHPAEVPSAAALHDLLVARAEQAVRPRLAELYPHRSALALGSAVSDRC